VNGIVASEERVQSGFEDVAVAVAPRRELPSQDVALLEDDGFTAGVGEIFCGGEPSRAAADDQRFIARVRSVGAFGFGRDEQS
jgi:hypothetical protein